MPARRGSANKPIVIGLTGNFGAGKTTAAGIFKKLGARVISADRLAHEAFKKENRVYRKLASLFPEVKGNLTRGRVAQIVFNDPKRRQTLEALIHPYVFRRIKEEISGMRRGAAVVEIPLLFETGFDKHCDATVVVDAPKEKVIRRLVVRGFGKAEALRRWRVQMPAAEKKKRADYVVDNSKNRKQTERQVKKIWQEIIET